MNKVYWKVYAFFILLTLAFGGVSGMISRSGIDAYQDIEKSALTPPNIVFPIVWTILFILMGISASIVFLSNSEFKEKALAVFILQLIVNFLWSPIFFNLQAFGFAFFWTLLLLALVIVMIYLFWKVDKTAALLQIPYALWVAFAALLTLMTWIKNR